LGRYCCWINFFGPQTADIAPNSGVNTPVFCYLSKTYAGPTPENRRIYQGSG
jgi:hypothetical protein